MPFKKRTFRRRFKKTYRRKKTYGKYKAKKFAQRIRYAMGKVAEKKNVDGSQTFNVDSVGTIVSFGLDGLPTGTSNLNRIGNEISLGSIHMKGRLALGDSTNFVRLIVIQWLKETASFTAAQQLIYNNGIPGFTWGSFYAKEYSGDFKVLKDKTWNLTSVSNPVAYFNFMINKGYKRNIRYNSQLGGNLVVKGAILGLLISDSAVATHPNVTIESRINFTDV